MYATYTIPLIVFVGLSFTFQNQAVQGFHFKRLSFDQLGFLYH